MRFIFRLPFNNTQTHALSAPIMQVAAGALYSGLGFVAASELAAAPVLSGVHAAALPSLVR